MVYTFQNSKSVTGFRGMHIDISVIKRMLLNLFHEDVLTII
jgi:hypothetical protein